MKELIAKYLFVKWLRPFIKVEKFKNPIQATREVRILLFNTIVATVVFSREELLEC